MSLTREYASRLSLFLKKSVFKIVVELVKADNQIHRNEVALLGEVQDVMGLSQEDLDLIHYLSLQEALEALRGLPQEDVQVLMGLFEDIIRVDNDVDFSENLLFCAVKTVLSKDSGKWSGLVSVSGVDAETTSEQIIYLEDGISAEAHKVFDDEYDFLLISKALADAGFSLFYLPNVISSLEQRWGSSDTLDSKYDILQRSMGYLVPSGDKSRINNLSTALKNLGDGDLYQVVLSRYNIAPAQIPSRSFLFLKVREGFVMDDDDVLRKTVDFLYIDIERDVKKRILSFVSEFDVKLFQLSYEGYYKILFDYLSVDSKTLSHIVIDDKWNFRLSDSTLVRFESSPQARCFYLLLLHYGSAGISQDVFDAAVSYLQDKVQGTGEFDLLALEMDLLRDGGDAALLLYNTIKIYGCLSTKDSQERSFLRYVANILQHRSSLKNYVNSGFSQAVRLANKEQYFIRFNSLTKSYCLAVSPSLFFHGDSALESTPLWKQLK